MFAAGRAIVLTATPAVHERVLPPLLLYNMPVVMRACGGRRDVIEPPCSVGL